MWDSFACNANPILRTCLFHDLKHFIPFVQIGLRSCISMLNLLFSIVHWQNWTCELLKEGCARLGRNALHGLLEDRSAGAEHYECSILEVQNSFM